MSNLITDVAHDLVRTGVTISDIHEELKFAAQTVADHRAEPGELVVTDSGGFAVQVADPLFGQTWQEFPAMPSATNDLMYLCKMPRRYFWRVMADHGATHFADHANLWLPKRRPVLVRTLAGMARAAMGPGYSVYDNVDVVEQARRFLDDEFDVPYTIDYYNPPTPDNGWRMRLRITIPEDYSPLEGTRRGLQFINDETGGSSIKVYPWVLRTTCWNSFTWVDGGFTRRHVYTDKPAVNAQVISAMGVALRHSEEIVHRMIEAEIEELPTIGKILADYAKAKGMKDEFVGVAGTGTEGKRTVMGLANGLTYAAHAMPGINPSERAMIEEDATAMLFNPTRIQRIINGGRLATEENAEMAQRVGELALL